MIVCQFPADFVWGAATSAYQIEGAVDADGRGASIWDRFSRQPGAIHGGDTGDAACDHYRRWREDVALMKELGLSSYRFSIAWPRLFPDGRRSQPGGIDFYGRLVDGLLEAGIQPMVTLYHWDLPAALQDEGGWARRDTAMRFRDYAAYVFECLGDRVRLWVTINEPWVASMVGHAFGVHAPGLRDGPTAVRVAHHLLLAHGLALEAFDGLGLRHRSDAEESGRIGLALDLHAYSPGSTREADVVAMERARTLESRWFLDSIVHGAYPNEGLAWYEARGAEPPILKGDMELISGPVDFLGINYYRRHVIFADNGHPFFGYRDETPPGLPVTDLGWEVYPEGLYEVLHWVHDQYGLTKLFVTENGAAYEDTLVEEGSGDRVKDTNRLAYVQSHLHQVWRAMEDGIPVEGYYAWSLLDNFEWAHGYSKRFGLVHVDFPTQRRVIKDSGLWYGAAARAGKFTVPRRGRERTDSHQLA